MDDIKDIIKNVVGNISQQKPNIFHNIDVVWNKIFDEYFLKHTKLVGIREGILSVIVDSPLYLYQLKTQKEKVLKQIQQDIPEIHNIQFKIGKVQ